MGNFSPKLKGRAWVVTVQKANMEKAGLTKAEYENSEYLAEFLSTLWNDSGKNRCCGVAVCVSEQGLYHAHMALYGNTTTLGNVSKILFDSHVEPQLGGKKELYDYITKNGKYAEKGEQVLYTKDLDKIQDNKGSRSDLDEIAILLNDGLSPEEIMAQNFKYRKYEKMINKEYAAKKIRNTPLIKHTFNEWHFGESSTGKTFYYMQLCKRFSPEQIYICNDFSNGGLDLYVSNGMPPILFLDEFKADLSYKMLLSILDKYSRAQTHCRYNNTYNLWTSTIITSVYSPDSIYEMMVKKDGLRKDIDTFYQLKRRLDVIVYHYKVNDNYYSYTIPANQYTNFADLMYKVNPFKDKSPINLTKNLLNLKDEQYKKLLLKRM